MIYIDPPYNTGKDFVYNDHFAKSKDAFEQQNGTFDEEGNQILDPMQRNSVNNGRYHTDWLNMIYPRLKVARDLLSDDGVIFISIDDNEIENLRKVCDEIYGECNFIAKFCRITKKGGKSSTATAKNNDYLLMFAHNTESCDINGVAHDDTGFCLKDEYFEERGFYKLNQTLDYDSLGWVESLDYPIKIGEEIFYAGGSKENYEQRHNGRHGRADWGWRWSKELFEFGFNNGFVEVKRGGQRPRIYTKTYQKVTIQKDGSHYKIVTQDRTKPLSTLEFTENEYSNDRAKSVIEELLGSGVFEYTKPVSLLYKTMQLIGGKDYFILDFFSGSATTAHAVMKLNAEDGGKRKFIMVQLPEVTDEKSEARKAGYNTICEIGEERIRRAGKKIKEEAGLQGQDLDIGFRVLKLDSSNMEDVYYTPDKLDATNLFSMVDNVKPDRTSEDLLFQVMLSLGIELSAKIEKTEIAGKEVWTVDDGFLMACFDDDVNEAAITEIAKRKPVYFVMRDSSAANDNVLDNFDQLFESYSPDTIRKIL